MSVSEDSLGQTHVTSACILYDETKESINWYIEQIIKVIPQLPSTLRTVVTDKHHTLRKCLKSQFPRTELLICKFHVSQHFRREVTIGKYNITSIKRDNILEILNKMIHSRNKTEFDSLCNNLFTEGNKKLTDYFNTNWKPIADEWVIALSTAHHFYDNLTNNRIESINSKLKSTIKKFSSLDDFFSSFFDIIKSMRIERKHNITKRLLNPVNFDTSNEILQSYYSHLNPFAFNIIYEQLQKLDQNTIEDIDTTPTNCSCKVYRSYHLPCSHIFKKRAIALFPMFDSSLCHPRWSRDYINRFLSLGNITVYSNETYSIKKKGDLNSYGNRLKNSIIYTNKIAAVSAEYCGEFYDSCISLFNSVEEAIKHHDMGLIKKMIQLSIFL